MAILATASPQTLPFFLVLVLRRLVFILLIATRAWRLLRLSFIVGYLDYVVRSCFELRRGTYSTDNVVTSYVVGTGAAGQVMCNAALLWFVNGDNSGRKEVLDVVRHEDDHAEELKPAERGFMKRL